MKNLMTLAAAAALMTGLTAPAQAAFYFEGLQPYTEAPNCNDPYATECGRYGHVPHMDEKPHKHIEAPAPLHVPDYDHAPKKPRYETREGLEK
jgi:hypothetical protein